jgi:uncharacterized protein (TIGR04255 family)
MTNASNISKPKRIKFESPPISELVVSLFYVPIPELRAQHIGIYWDRIRERYPRCEQQNVVVSPSDAASPSLFQEVPGEVLPLPRFWFSSDAHPILVQVQRNAFMLNWRRLPGASAGEYPHYENVSSNFWDEFEKYKRFIEDIVGGKIDVIQRCELSYINIISAHPDIFTQPSQLMGVVPSVASLYELQTDGRALVSINTTVTYQVDPTMFVDLIVRGFGRRSDTNELAAALELRAHGAPSDLSLDTVRAWYDSAHDATYKLFLDATAKQVQETIWKPR